MTPEEKAYIIWKKSKHVGCSNMNRELRSSVEYDNSSVGEVETFALSHVWAAFKDWQVWLQILVYMSIIGPRE